MIPFETIVLIALVPIGLALAFAWIWETVRWVRLSRKHAKERQMYQKHGDQSEQDWRDSLPIRWRRTPAQPGKWFANER